MIQNVVKKITNIKPKLIIDMATLTGACIVALGHHLSGLMSNSDNLANKLLDAGETSGDGTWRLPLGKKYMDQLKSNFADVSNISGGGGGAQSVANVGTASASSDPSTQSSHPSLI